MTALEKVIILAVWCPGLGRMVCSAYGRLFLRLGPRLNVKGAKYGAFFERTLISGGSTMEEDEARFGFLQLLPTANEWKYKSEPVTLIDETARCQAFRRRQP